MDGLYHRQLGFPNVPLPCGTFLLSYTRHAIKAAQTDRYGKVNLPKWVEFGPEDVVEIEVKNAQVSKMLVRIAYSERFDLCLVMLPGDVWAKVLTVWLNHRLDRHDSLNVRRYTVLREEETWASK
jgi:hypothetical protein